MASEEQGHYWWWAVELREGESAEQESFNQHTSGRYGPINERRRGEGARVERNPRKRTKIEEKGNQVLRGWSPTSGPRISDLILLLRLPCFSMRTSSTDRQVGGNRAAKPPGRDLKRLLFGLRDRE